MSKNAFIDLIARLNKNKSKSQIKEDLKVISGELNGLKDNGLNIQCHIDTSSEAVNKLQGELNTLANKLKLNIGVDAKSIASTVTSKTQSDNSATTSTVKIDKMSTQSQVEELGRLLRSNLKGEADTVLKGLLEETRNTLGQTTEIWTTWERNAEGALKSFSISTKQATGDLQKFNYAVEEGGKVSLLGSNGSDRGILQKQKETLKFIDEYTAKINSLRSSSNSNFTTVYNGETVGFKSLLDDLEKLRNGKGSVEDIRAKFVALQGTIDSIKVTVKESQGKSFNPFTNANITAKEFDNTLKLIGVDLSNLKGFNYTSTTEGIPKVSELNKEYKSLNKTIADLNSVEESQRSNQWYMDYADASERVRQLQSDIKLLNKLKREDTSSGTKKQLEEFAIIKNGYRELQKLEKDRYSYKTGSKESAYIGQLSGGLTTSINAAKKRLENEGLLTSELKKQIQVEEKAYNQAVKRLQLRQQDRETINENARIEKEANDKRSQYMSEITNAYSRMNAEYSKLNNPKLSQEERNLAQERINWNEKIIEYNKELLNTENLLTQKNGEKLKQLKEINEQKQKEAQAGANRVTQSQAETERLRQEKKEANALAKTITEIVNGYEKLATLYSGKTAPTNGTAKSNINKAESARQHSELQAQLSELTEIANANDKITKQQQQQIANAKIQYERSVERTNQYNQQLVNEQNQTRIEREQQAIADEITQTYKEMARLYGKVNNPNKPESVRKEALYLLEEKQSLVDTLSVSQQFTAEQEKQIQKAKQGYQNYQRLKDKADEGLNVERLRTKEYNNLVQKVKQYTDILSKFNNSRQVKQNTGFAIGDDPNKRITVSQQIKDNDILLKQLNDISNILSQGKDPKVLKDAQKELNKIIGELDVAKKNSQEFTNTLTNNKIARDAERNLNTIRNQINKFGNFNPKAINSTQIFSDSSTYADEYRRIQEMANNASLKGNADKVNELTTAFKNFEQRARAAGLTTSQFFTSMGSQLKMVLNRYISLYAVIGYIRKMVDNVKVLDEAMINVRRVTDETDNGYLAFLEKANKQAQDLKVVTSDLVEQTYQWAKLGYDLNDALELSRASTIFSKVADASQEQSLQNLITILKAYGIEAKNVMDVVDKMDNLNNRYAVSAAGLGEGLERSASTLAMTGASLDKSLALLTGTGEITQNLENTGNAVKILSLRLRNMKGALEQLNEPTDDLMEVSKVQTQILNLTGNQVDIFDSKTKDFKDIYDIMEDIAEVWDSLNSTNRASLTEILFGKNRANIGLAIIQAFQSGTIQNAYRDSVKSAGTATAEYEKMMDGIEAHSNALKGSLQELSNAVFDKETINFFIDKSKLIIDVLSFIFKQAGSLSVVFGVLLATISAITKVNVIGALKGIAQWFGIIKTNADSASKALAVFKTFGNSLLSLGFGVAVGFLINKLSQFVDTLIVTNKEMEESITSATNDMVDLGKAVDDLKQSEQKLDSIAQSYSKIVTTIADVSERKTKLQEVQNDLVTSYKDEADGVDLVNGKYSEQLKKLDEIAKKEKENFELEHAAEINKARRYANLNISAPSKVATSPAGIDMYDRLNDKKGDNKLYTLEDLDPKAIRLGEDIEGVYRTLDGTFDPQGLYLSGTIEDARNQLVELIKVYERVPDYEDKTLKRLEERLIQFNTIIENIKKFAPDELNKPNDNSPSSVFGSMLGGLSDIINSAFNETSLAPFYNKLDEAQAKLQQLANPDDLSLGEYQTLYYEVGVLENSLYKMAGSSEEAKQKVADLFNGFKQGVVENGDGLDNFVQKWKTELDENFKSTAETVTTVQEAISKLGEGKGLSHTDAWKLLEQDADGYLQTIKLINGEYVFSEQELIAFKDAQIKKSQETIKENIHEGEVAIKNLQAEIKTRMQNLYSLQKEFDLKVKMRQINSESDYKIYHDEITKTKFTIQQMEESMLGYGRAIDRDKLLIEELNQNLGTTRTISVGMETDLNNTVKALENEVKAVDDTIDSLNNRKDALESEKKELQEQLDILNEQKKVIEEQQKSFQKAVTDYMKRYEDSLKSQLDSLKQQQDDIKDEYEERIKVLKDENEERDLAYKKEKALLDLDKAKQQQVRTYSSARGWEYGASKENVVETQKNLNDVLNEEQIKALEKERDEKIKPLEKQEKALDHQIKAYEEYVKQYDILTEEIENKDGELLAEQLLGSNWRERIEKKDEGLLRAYKQEYENFTVRLEQLTEVEIKNIEDGIKAKEKDIDKIGEEITAYNNYKTTVQDSLNDAKSALEDYKNNVSDYCNQMSDSFYHMQDSIYNDHNKIVGWFGAVASAARSMRDEIGSGAIGGAMMGLHLAGFADGGTNSTTGIAMLHGTKQKSETIFNANDSKKLYEAVHETPSVMASIIKQAVQLSGFNPSNIVNNNGANTNSVNVNIGQVVANNPQDFVRNLDPHLDAYFKRKLTQSYTQ